MAERLIIQGSVGRAIYGVIALCFPKLFEQGPGAIRFGPDARYMNRLFGARDILLALISIFSVQRGNVREALAINMIAEASDTVAVVTEIADRGGVDKVTAGGVLFNVAGFANWIRAAKALRSGS